MKAKLVVAVLVAVFAAATWAQEEKVEVPVTKIVLFSSGVGYFEHTGSVTGDATTRLMFKTDQINDVLKSMVLMDLDGGTVRSVNYASRDPLDRALKSFAVDVSGKPTMAQLLDQLRGATVVVKAPSAITGKILGVEARTEKVVAGGSTTLVTEYTLNLVTAEGIKSLPLSTVQGLALQDKTLQGELDKALDLLIASHDTQRKPVNVRFSGDGQRRVKIGYIAEAPVWKTSYRLDLSGDEPALQGWAIVENTSDADWSKVDLSLVSGRPISFIQDLYTPLYLPRPVVKPELYASLMPRVYDEGIGAPVGAEEQLAGRARGRADMALRKAVSRRALAMEEGRAAYGAALPTAPGVSLAAGIESIAATEKVGELFNFAIREPVTLARRGSAMLPIVQAKIKAEKVSIYNQSVMPKNPLNGAWLVNSTGMKMMGGPVTVFDSGTYGGDARIDNLVPDDKRLISYAVDLNVTVDPSQKSSSRIVSMKIVRGVLQLRHQHDYTQTYAIKNKADGERQIIVEHPFHAERKLVEPAKSEEKTPALYRFRVAVGEGKTVNFDVKESQITGEAVALLNRPADSLLVYTRNTELPKKVREALADVIARKNALEQLKSELAQAERELNSITQGQERLRRNLNSVGKETELGRRYLTKLAEEEDQIEALQARIDELRKKVIAAEKELADFFGGLNIE